jgi:pimeloyl-ACP methyl ester carboxylesterase
MRSVERRSISVGGAGDELVGWVGGDGPPVLLLHGGPGLSYRYLDDLAEELAGEGDGGYEIASYQQRGLAPSTTDGPFTVETAVADAVRFMDAVGFDRAYVVGHSWGGHLLLHLAVTRPDRLLGGVAVDPLGGVGDGGRALFEKEMGARTADAGRRRAVALERQATGGAGTADEFMQSLRIFWPAYFAVPETAPAMPDIEASIESYAGLTASLGDELPRLTDLLPTVSVPLGFVAGARSPLPAGEASGATAALVPGSFLEIIEDAGHFPWVEQPGRVRAALDRLVVPSTPV